MPRKKSSTADRTTQQRAGLQSLKCPWCPIWYKRPCDYRRHIRSHPQSLTRPPQSPPNKLFSRRTADESDGVFDFANVLDEDNGGLCFECEPDSDNDSYFSDFRDNHDESSTSSNDQLLDADADSDDDSGISFIPSDNDEDVEDELSGFDIEEDDDDDDEDVDDEQVMANEDAMYFTPKQVHDDDVPFSDSTFPVLNNFNPPSSFTMQLQLNHLFNRNKGSLKMYDETIEIIQGYINSLGINGAAKLLPRQTFLSRVEDIFSTEELKPTYGSVRLHNGSIATVPVFDMKAMILSILHDESLMRAENFATGLDIFTGDVDDQCEHNNCYGEIHTGDAWLPAKERFAGTEGKYMPFGLVIFGDKSHTDLHGSLSVTPITFTATFFNRAVRNNPDSWRPIAYIPNLTYGKGNSRTACDKVQDEQNCLAYAFKSLIELSELGGIRTMVMGKEVIVKPFIHYFIGDTEGNNKWLGHYQGSKPGMMRPYRDCQCGFDSLNASNPQCEYTKAREFRRAMRLVVDNKKEGMKLLSSMSRHCVNNALYQTKLPLSDVVHGANKMFPPETLHTLDAGLTIYMFESLQGLMSGGKSRADLDEQHVRMSNVIRRQSERDFPRGATRSGLIDSTRCQSSERKGNLFLLLCIAHTVDGAVVLQHELNYTAAHWRQWLELLKLYLAMEEWFHDACPKEEVRRARPAVSMVMEDIQRYFPRSEDSHGYKIPKMHGLSKMIEYMTMFGSAINFYGGPGEALHKSFVKAPGLKSQTAGQYYNVMAVKKAAKYVDIRAARERVREEHNEQNNNTANEEAVYTVRGGYTVDINPDKTVRVKSNRSAELEKHGLSEVLLQVMNRLSVLGYIGNRITGYTRAVVFGSDGESASYNAHPFYHGGPWYDWAYVHYEIGEEDESTEEYYPSKIIGFIKDDDEVKAVIQCSVDAVPWTELEENFIAPFELNTKQGEEEIVPMSSLCHPICVVPDYGATTLDKYMMILPKGQWSAYFARVVNDEMNVEQD